MPTRPHKVLYVVARFPNARETFVAQEMAVVQANGVDVHVASLWSTFPGNPTHPVDEQFLDKHIRVRLTSATVWLRAIQQLIARPVLFAVLFRLIVGHCFSIYSFLKVFANIPKGLYLGYWACQQGFDHIHAHFLTSPATAALIASKASGIPFSVTSHAFDIYSTSPKTRNGAVRYKLESAAVNVMISEYNLRFIQERWQGVKASFVLIYNGIDLSVFDPTLSAPARTDDTIRILSNGALIEKKGHAYLIRAVNRLREQGYNVDLSIIGEGILRVDLQKLVQDLHAGSYVRFLGVMTQTDVVRHYRESDIFALACVVAASGDRDGLPTVLIESLAMDMPTISTQVTGVPEIVQDGVTGWCVPPGDVDQLAAALADAIDRPDEAMKRAKQGRQLVEERFDRQKNAVKVLEAWQTFTS